jgi:hypothetical protein
MIFLGSRVTERASNGGRHAGIAGLQANRIRQKGRRERDELPDCLRGVSVEEIRWDRVRRSI